MVLEIFLVPTIIMFYLKENYVIFIKKESALLFNSGYLANQATLSTLGKKLPDCIFFSDEKNHASMIQGIKNSGAKKVIFKHNDLEDLERNLIKFSKVKSKNHSF